MKRAIAYLRVSTVEQTTGFGLEVQEEAIRKWARAEGFRLVDVTRDEGLSGSNGLEDRPGLSEALARLEAAEAEALVVYRLDRLARGLIIQETVVARLVARGVRVFSVTEPDIDSEDPTRTLVRQVLGAISQYERSVIKARMQAGKAAKSAQGRYAGGRPAYGLRAEGKELVPVDAEQEVIALARRFRRDGASLRSIAHSLEVAGHAPKAGGRWHPTSVARLLD